jgi:hypothetical protein
MAEVTIAYRNGMVVAKPLSEDDEDGGPGRILTVEEFIDRLRNRADIFGVDKNHRLRNSEIAALLFALVAGLFTSQIKSIKVTTDFYMKKHADAGLVMVRNDVAINRPVPAHTTAQKPVVVNADKPHSLRPPKNAAISQSRPSGTGGGSIHDRLTASGVLGIIAGKIKGRDAADGDILGKNGFAKGIDAILSGMQGLKQGSSSVASRPGAHGIGFGPGYSSGYNGDRPVGIDDVINSLMEPTESALPLTLKTGPPRQIDDPSTAIISKAVGIIGDGRKKSDIMRVVMQNLQALRYVYNRRLRDRPGLRGRITVKFAVDEFGNVIACDVVSSSMADKELEEVIAGKILRWRFDKIDKPGDITEVVYPFVLST